MREHDLKTWPEPFQAVWRGEKHYELRRDDRSYEVGDTLILNEWDPNLMVYSGRHIRAYVSYITRNKEDWGLKPGFCIMSLDLIRREGL